MTKTLEQRIREAMVFDFSAQEHKRQDDVTHLPEHDEFREGFLEGHGEGAQWQHAVLTRDWLPLMIEMAEALEARAKPQCTSKYCNCPDCNNEESAQKLIGKLDRLLEKKERKP